MTEAKILVTGGHITPVIATLDALSKLKKVQIIFVGREHANAQSQIESLEFKLIQERGIKFYDLKTTKLSRNDIVGSIVSFPVFLKAIFKSYQILKKEKPRCIVTFGGYIALPVAIAGKIIGIPILTHEQTLSIGLANKIIATIANTVCLSWPQTKKGSYKHEVLTGNPIRIEFFAQNPQPEFWPKQDLPILYITGGSLGSHAINQVVYENLTTLLSSYNLIHQSGNTPEFHDYDNLQEKRSTVPSLLKERYVLKTHLSADEAAYTMKNASLLIGRSGANTVSEILQTAIPSILIPLPWAGGGEQTKQADFLENLGISKKIEQKDLKGPQLLEAINSLQKEKMPIKKKIEKNGYEKLLKSAANRVAEEIEALLVQ